MRYCKNCHILYSSEAAACPKCGIAQPDGQPQEAPRGGEQPAADKKAVRRDWLWLIIGVPILIGVIYAAVFILKQLG